MITYSFLIRYSVREGLAHKNYPTLGRVMNIDDAIYYGVQNIFFLQSASVHARHFAIEATRFMTGRRAVR